MAYSFRHSDKSVEAGLKRIARSQIDKALDEFDNRGRAEAVHQVRKRCKKLRGLLRLVRPHFADYKKENAAFRDAARLLSPIRDRAAMIEAFNRIAVRFEDEIDTHALAPIREQLGETRKDPDDDETERLERFRAAMVEARERVDNWSLDSDGPKTFEGGVEKTYARAVDAMAEASDKRTGEVLHEWRKRVKYHWYHARLLKRGRKDLLDEEADAAGDLSDILGDHHDIVVFEAEIESGGLKAEGPDGELFKGLLKTRRATLEEKAFAKGALACSEKPKNLARRWAGYWRATTRRSEQTLC